MAVSELSYAGAGCGSCTAGPKLKPEPKPEAKKELTDKDVKYIDKDELQKVMKANDKLAIVDVLSPDSYIEGHVKGAINIPLKHLEKKEYIDMLKKYKTVVVYCANTKCKASTKAALLLMKNGLPNVVDYKGGIADYKEAKLELETGTKCKCGAAKGSPICCK